MKIVKFVYNLRVHQLGETFVVVGFFSIESARTGIKKKREGGGGRGRKIINGGESMCVEAQYGANCEREGAKGKAVR